MEIGPHKYYSLERLQSREVGRPPALLFHRCKLENAERHLRNGYMHCFPYICTTENPAFCSPGRCVFVIDSKCLLDAGYVIYPYIWSQREPAEAEWRISPPGTELVFFSGGPHDPHAHATGRETLPLSCVAGIGVANKSVVYSWDEEKMKRVEELAAQRGYAVFDFSWEEWWDDGPIAETRSMRKLNPETPTLYHITFMRNVDSILNRGILPDQPPFWKVAKSKKRYSEKGYIYAMDHISDAVRWGCQTDQTQGGKWFTGNVAIIEFVDPDGGWEEDPNQRIDEYTATGIKGKWLRKKGGVAPQNIKSVTVMDESTRMDLLKKFASPNPPDRVVREPSANPAPNRFWGKAGAGILFFCTDDKTYLLTTRSAQVEQPGTVGIPGGSCKGEGFYSEEEGRQVGQAEAWACAMREVTEELGWFPHEKKIVSEVLFEKGNFTYRTFIVEVPLAEKKIGNATMQMNWENDDARWFKVNTVWYIWPKLHFGAQYVFNQIYGMDSETPPKV